MQIPSSLSHVASLGGARESFFPHARKVPVYYLNNGSRARIIVSLFFLSQRVTLLVTEERQREVEWGCSVSSRGRKLKGRMTGGKGRGSSSVPDSRYGKDRITTSQDEGCSSLPFPPLVLSLFARSRADRHGVSWLFSNFLWFSDRMIGNNNARASAASSKSA